jgi:hypothetical protein
VLGGQVYDEVGECHIAGTHFKTPCKNKKPAENLLGVDKHIATIDKVLFFISKSLVFYHKALYQYHNLRLVA